MEAKDGETLAAEFGVIEKLLKSRFAFDSPGNAFFYEGYAQALVWTDLDAIQVLHGLHIADDLASSFSEILGMGQAANVSLRFAPVNSEVHSEDWWDVHIEPSFRSPHKCYRVSFLLRNPERNKVMNFVKDINQLIESSIRLLESFRG